MTDDTLKGRSAVVTGASGDIGRAIGVRLASRGARLCLVGRNAERLDAAARAAGATGTPVLVQPADLGDDDDIRRLVARIGSELETVDILVHGAGIITPGTHERAAIDAFDAQYRANVRGPYLLTQMLLPMLRARQGEVIFINSSVGRHARGGVGQYAATKHALTAVADSLRDEVNAHGVRVLSLFLGRTATAGQAEVFASEGRPYRPELLMQPDDVAAMVLAALALPRTAEVTDISMRPLRKSY